MAACVMFQLTLTPNKATRLSDVYPGGAPSQPDPTKDIPYRWLVFQAEGGDVLFGDSSVNNTKYGMRLGVGTVRDATGSLGPFGSGAVRLSDFYATGAGVSATLHILGLVF